MKKPLIKHTTRRDKARVILFFVLTVAALSLFFLPTDHISVMASGKSEAPKSLFGLISRFA
ncbi:MAG: hypothetical protein IIX67_02395 [Clostridia bacterium]|nr:hypothetical protein [Clostridia bacterium]